MNILYYIRTNSIDTDDRFIKTRDFLIRAGFNCDVYAVVKHRSESDVSIAQILLWSRRFLPTGSFKLLKYFELLIRAGLCLISSRRRCWFANFDFFPLHIISAALFTSKNRPIVDLHEMPPEVFARNLVLRHLMAWVLSRSKVIVCNNSRRVALEELFGIDLSGALVLRNLPDAKTFSNLRSYRTRYIHNICAGADVSHNVVIVGGMSPGRYVSESLEVLAKLSAGPLPNLHVKIVGGDAPNILPSIAEATGRIAFDELTAQSVEGEVSLCFYDPSTLNNRFCEPNRFFQALSVGQYVITFEHPSLRSFAYPWHRTIQPHNFSVELSEVLVSIFSDPSKCSERFNWANIPKAPNLVFDRQFCSFKQWL